MSSVHRRNGRQTPQKVGASGNERRLWEHFGEGIRELVGSVYIAKLHLFGADQLPDVVLAQLDVFVATANHRVVGHVDAGLVVFKQQKLGGRRTR